MAADQTNAIAMIYAEALFELAQEQGVTAAMREELDGLVDVLKANPEFESFLDSPAFNRDQKGQTMIRIFEGKVSDLMLDFLKVMASKDRLMLLDEVQACFAKLEDELAGRVHGTLTTAVEMSESEKARLGEQIGRALKKTITLEYSVDPEILGGMTLTVEDTVMDASVKGSIDQLKKTLMRESIDRLPKGRELVIE